VFLLARPPPRYNLFVRRPSRRFVVFGDRALSIVVAVIAAFAIDFFFSPPMFTLTPQDPNATGRRYLVVMENDNGHIGQIVQVQRLTA
jgi:K+-sensing histidine kinase KdpD